MEIVEELSAGSSDVAVILKGKRTKRRQRPLSPLGCRAAAMTSSSSAGEDGEVVGYFTTSMSTDISATSTTSHHQEEEEDDQDIANCLILLAQGERGTKQVKPIDHHQHHEEQDQNHQNMKMQKFSSKKLNETEDRVGIFVYECKTCNRTFPSFQALGGHRASHKKPKTTEDDKKAAAAAATGIPPPPPPPPIDVEELILKEEHGGQIELSGKFFEIKASGTNHKAKNHHHECSICGAEFSSGQALGGHMRRHRNPPPHLPPHAAVMTSQVSMVGVVDEAEKKNPRKSIFTFDLNLPPPVEEEIHVHRDLKFQRQQHHLVFSAPALVGCHY